MIRNRIAQLAPGIALCAAIALAAMGLQWVEEHWAGRPWLEALVIAILLGTIVRTLWTPDRRWVPGIGFSARTLLEVAVMLLGASISFQAVLDAGLSLIIGIAVVVVLAIGASYGLGRWLGLPKRMAVLIACGNSICGNSAIAAVAPVIGAKPEDVASSIAFTAILGVIVVLALPLLVPLLGLSMTQYGVLAGLTVYAVPQVLAATVPVSLVSTQLGTLVKLVRVLMLGPVVITLSLVAGRSTKDAKPSLSWNRLVPWFIVGFLGLAVLRSLGVIPDAILQIIVPAATLLTIISMAALGLGVDLKVLKSVGARVTLAVTLSLLVLIAISLSLIRLLNIA
ncbi:YeiH family putative sulfate export transporter [Microvirga sp. 3-52]|uniref:YeiH family protein n=1 Tax=Microvirga sp. 3-52 TaxID=2792425 RepID=UPI001AD0858D|nr:YeiH family protein [Microvirga sp. 3-52]MBO1905951.1 YeiH family putative sulfate export transporter [Microvirga sp. 3-52]MBS7453154.1 YeiH family putative sulfate export transporter [Microvirga sp. 3-52]